METKIMNVTITKKRLEQLEDAEERLLCLEAGGVDNWEGYSVSLDNYFEKKDKNEIIKQKVSMILEITDNGIIEPAGAGCGFGCDEKTHDEVYKFVKTHFELKEGAEWNTEKNR